MDPAFEVHKLNERGMKKAERLAAAFDTHLAIVKEIVGESDPRPFDETLSIGRTVQRQSSLFLMMRATEHLELASFYTKKCLAQKIENQLGPVEEAGKRFVADTVAAAPEQESPSTVGEILRLARRAKFTDRERDMIVKAVIERS